MMRTKYLIPFLFLFATPTFAKEPPAPKHFPKVMVIIFENMSYSEIKDEPTFKKLVEYTGNSLDAQGRLVKLAKRASNDGAGNGYAFFSQYYNNHNGGAEPSRPSQPNYIAMTSGSVQGLDDNENHDLDVDNLGMELVDAKISWKVYAQGVPDAKFTHALRSSKTLDATSSSIKPYRLDTKKNEQKNDDVSHQYYSEQNKKLKLVVKKGFLAESGCFVGDEYGDVDDNRDVGDGYVRKHEPFISYLNIQTNNALCKHIVNGKHLVEDLAQMPEVSFYIPNLINDGHNGELPERIINANAFLSKMLGRDPKTGELLANANAPLEKFMEQGGLLVITFDEPSVTGNPDNKIYTLLAGKMINSGAYPSKTGENAVVCYPSVSEQTSYPKDVNGDYEPADCNHYNLLKMIEANWKLRGLQALHTSSGYKYAYPLDHSVPQLWKQ